MSLAITSSNTCHTPWDQRVKDSIVRLNPGDIEVEWGPHDKYPTPHLKPHIYDHMKRSLDETFVTGLTNVKDVILASNPGVHAGKTARALQYKLTRQLAKDKIDPGNGFISTGAANNYHIPNSKPHTDGTQIMCLGYAPPCSGNLSLYRPKDENGAKEIINKWRRDKDFPDGDRFYKFTPEGQDLGDYHFYAAIDQEVLHGASDVPSNITKRPVQIVSISIRYLTNDEAARQIKKQERSRLLFEQGLSLEYSSSNYLHSLAELTPESDVFKESIENKSQGILYID